MRKDPTFWLALAVAFVLGLLPGLALVAYQRQAVQSSAADSAADLRSKQTAWETQKGAYEEQLASAEETASRLETQVTSLTAEVTRLKGAGTADPQLTQTSSSSTKPVIVERSVDGQTTAGQRITLVVKVKGDADKVTMRIARVHPDDGWVKTYDLEDAGASGGVHMWKATVACPSDKGDYRFFADAYLGDTHVTMPGVSAYMFTVE